MTQCVPSLRESILKTAKALVEDTKLLVAGAASSQEKLAQAAQSSAKTITQLTEVVKLGATSMGSEDPETQVMKTQKHIYTKECLIQSQMFQPYVVTVVCLYFPTKLIYYFLIQLHRALTGLYKPLSLYHSDILVIYNECLLSFYTIKVSV